MAHAWGATGDAWGSEILAEQYDPEVSERVLEQKREFLSIARESASDVRSITASEKSTWVGAARQMAQTARDRASSIRASAAYSRLPYGSLQRVIWDWERAVDAWDTVAALE